MKKELILLACMTAGPYLLNSAGQWADTIEKKSHMENVGNTVRSSELYECSGLDVFGKYSNLSTYGPPGYALDCGDKSAIERPLSYPLQDSEPAGSKSSIRANWTLDTLASAYNEMLVYTDSDNPELKATLFTDDTGNMLLQLEQEGKIREIRVQKVEFHTPVNTKRGKHQLNKLRHKVSSGEKGAAYVPV